MYGLRGRTAARAAAPDTVAPLDALVPFLAATASNPT